MPTVVHVDINKLLCEIKSLTAANKRLETFVGVGLGCALALYFELKRKNKRIKELMNENTELKKVEGE